MATGRQGIVERRMQQKHEEDYKRRLKNVKGTMDFTPPREYAHLQIEFKRAQVEKERQAEIDRKNLVIIDKLTEIKLSSARVDNWNKDWKPSNDRLRRFRDRKQRRIDEENRQLAERIKNAESYYSTEDWERDYQRHLYYLSMLENSTKDYDTIDDEGSDEFYSDEDSDSLPPVPPGTPDKDKGKKSSDSEDNLSLPPIDDKRNKAKKEEESKEGYSEHEAIMDAEELKAAIDANDKAKIMEILGRTTEKERLKKLEEKYKELYEKDLNEDLKSAVDEDTIKALESLSADAAEEDAKTLYDATKGLGTDEDALIEILCTRTNEELAAIKKVYEEKYKSTLEEDLRGDTSGDLETLLVELSKGQRDESKEADKKLAKQDAKDLMEAGPKSWGTDEGVFIRVFTQRSLPQLAATFPEYKKLAKADISESIDKEMDGDLQKAFLTLVKITRDPDAAKEDKLKQAIKDGDLEKLANIILPMNKAQINKLSSSYKKNNGTSLADDIEKIADKGDLKALLVAKIGKGQEEKGKKGAKKGKDKDKLPPIHPDKGKTQKTENKKTDKNASPKKKDGEKQNEKKDEKAAEKQAEEDAKRDAEELHQAIEDGNKDRVIDILAKNCGDKGKLQKLQSKYQEKHKQDLLEALQPHLDDDVQDPVTSLFTPSSEYDAKCLYDAMKGLGTDEDLLIEVLCTRTNEELSEIKKAYKQKYESTLEDDIKGDTSGDFEDLLVKLAQGTRDESTKVKKDLAKKDAEALQKAGVKSFGTDEDTFVEILTQRSLVQLNATFDEYKKIQKVEIEQSIDEEMDGDLGKGLLALVKCIRNTSSFRRDKLKKALESGDTSTLARVILGMDKATLNDIMSDYKASNKKNLDAEVEKKCSPNLNKLLQGKMGKYKPEKNKSKQDPKNKSKNEQAAAGSKPKKQGDAAKNKKEIDPSELHKAIEDDDKKKIKEIMVKAACDKSKLKKLSNDYKKEYGEVLVDVLDGTVEEDILEAVVAMVLPPTEADVRTLYYAMKGAGTKEAQLIEILCSRNNEEIAAIKKQYEKKYSRSLEQDVKGEVSGDFEDLLVALLSGKRDESTEVNDDQAHKDAETLIEAGIKKWGTDEDCFIEIFTTRSYTQLQAMLPEYSKWAKCEIEESVRSEMDGELRDGLLVLIKSVRGTNDLYAEKLHTSLLDGDTATVARIIAGVDEGTLSKMESAYNASYKPKLYFEVEKKCSNDLNKILLPKIKDKTPDKKTRQPKQGAPKKQQAGGKPANKEKEQKAGKKEEKEDEITRLHKAIDKEDKKTATEIVVKNASDKGKLKKLADDYKKRHEKELIEALDCVLDDDIHEAVTSLLLPQNEADVRNLYYAMKGVGTKEAQLIEILCTRTNKEINQIKEDYNKKYSRSLVDDVKSETGGDFEDLLTALLKGTRDQSTSVDSKQVTKDAAALIAAGVAKWGTDEDVFIQILTQRSHAHTQAVLSEYKALSGGTDLVDTVRDEMDGDLKDALVMLISCAQDPCKAQADKLYNALQDGDTVTVARILTATDEATLADIESCYNTNYKPKAYFEVDKKCSTDLKKIILAKLKDKKQEKEKKGQKPKEAAGGRKPSVKDKEQKENKPEKKKDDECSELHTAIEEKEQKKTLTTIILKYTSDKPKLKRLREEYKKRYEEDLIDALDDKLDEDVHEAMTLLLLTQVEADARTLYYAMKGVGTKELQLIEVLCSRSKDEIAAIKDQYNKKYGRSLSDDVKSETTGDFETLMVALLKGTRDESSSVDSKQVTKDAAALIAAGVAKWGTDEDVFIDILTQRSHAHIQAVLSEYKTLSGGTDLVDTVRDEMDGDLKDALVMLISCAQDPCKAQADKLYNALHDGDTVTVARILTANDEATLAAIEESYNSTYKPKAYFEVEKKCSEDLKKIVLSKLKDNTEEKEERPKLDIQKVEYHGTVAYAKNFDAAEDADKLKKAMKGFGSDEEAIISVLVSCNLAQRQEIVESFRQQFDKDLLEELKSELSGKFEDAIVALIQPPDVCDANALHAAMKGLGTKDSVLVEIICSRSAEELQAIKKAFQTAHDSDLTETVKSETSGDFQALLVALLDDKRISTADVDEDMAYKDAEDLYQAGEKKWGTDESVFTRLLTSRGDMQLRALFQAYKNVAKCDILETIDQELSGDYHDAVAAVVKSTRNPQEYFAGLLNSALNGLSTDSTAVARIIISRSEIDLSEIKAAYKEAYEKTLSEEVKELCKGDHEKLLLDILRD